VAKFADTTVFQRKTAIEQRPVDRAAVLVNPNSQLYFGVNRVGARIWNLLENPCRIPELVCILSSEFAVDEAVCRNEIEVFLEQLLAENLVVRAPQTSR